VQDVNCGENPLLLGTSVNRARGGAEVWQSRPTLLKTLYLSMRLTSFSPTSDYPSFYLYWYVYLVYAVQNGVHPFDHRLL
jgi:hypothetical protein